MDVRRPGLVRIAMRQLRNNPLLRVANLGQRGSNRCPHPVPHQTICIAETMQSFVQRVLT